MQKGGGFERTGGENAAVFRAVADANALGRAKEANLVFPGYRASTAERMNADLVVLPLAVCCRRRPILRRTAAPS